MTVQPTIVSTEALAADAKNRALRTAVQGLAIDLGVAVLLVIGTALSTAKSWGDIQWSLIALTLAKTVVQTIVSFAMRRYSTKENALTPPAPQPEPAVPLTLSADRDVTYGDKHILDEPEPEQHTQVIAEDDPDVVVYPDQTPEPLSDEEDLPEPALPHEQTDQPFDPEAGKPV